MFVQNEKEKSDILSTPLNHKEPFESYIYPSYSLLHHTSNLTEPYEYINEKKDHIIDLGVEGGDGGGTIVVTGTPEEVAKCEKSYTGQFLKRILGE